MSNIEKTNLTSENKIDINAADSCLQHNGSLNTDIETLYDLSELFKVFGDSTRIRILYTLLSGEKCVLHLTDILQMGQSAISHQLRILRASGLVRPRRSGKTVFYSLDDEHVAQILAAGLDHITHGR